MSLLVIIDLISVDHTEIYKKYHISPLGGVHAVHQYCGAFCRKHELQSSPAVRVHTAGTGRLPGGEKTHTHTLYCILLVAMLYITVKI